MCQNVFQTCENDSQIQTMYVAIPEAVKDATYILFCHIREKVAFYKFDVQLYIGLVSTKPVFVVSDKARFKPVSSVTGTS